MISRSHSAVLWPACLPALLCGLVLASPGQAGGQNAGALRPQASVRQPENDPELVRLRRDLVARIRESRAMAEKVLVLHEQQQGRLKQDLERHRALFEQGIISRAELAQVEHALSLSTARLEEDRMRLKESDLAITEATFGEELARAPRLPRGAYNDTGKVMRYNGAAAWSLTDSGTVEAFFTKTFGYALPISAFGQTPTHDRLRFDHRNAVDVALHPDSPEGRSLLSFLREARIPFIAFRSAAPGSATGPHIHIGRPSPRY